MSQLQLYNYFRSSTSYRARIVLNLKNLPYDYKPVHLLNKGGEQHSAEYKKINPLGEVPTLVDGDFAFAQSFAIVDYLDEKYPTPPLYPKDIKAKARVKQICENINCGLHPLQNLKVLQYLQKEFNITDAQKQQWLDHWLPLGLKATEEIVKQTRGQFCVGDQITMSDVFLVPQFFSSQRFNIDIKAFPNLYEINQRCLEIEAFKKAHPLHQPDTPDSL